jgi:hypothetical protein
MSKRRRCLIKKTKSKILLHYPFKLGHLTLPPSYSRSLYCTNNKVKFKLNFFIPNVAEFREIPRNSTNSIIRGEHKDGQSKSSSYRLCHQGKGKFNIGVKKFSFEVERGEGPEQDICRVHLFGTVQGQCSTEWISWSIRLLH